MQEAVRQQREREYRARVLAQCGSLYLVFEYVEHDLGGLIDARYQVSAMCASASEAQSKRSKFGRPHHVLTARLHFFRAVPTTRP